MEVRRNLARVAVLAGAMALVGPVSAHAAAVDMFLKLDGLPGESGDKAHSNEIIVSSFNWDVTTGGSDGGRPTFSDFTIQKPLDRTSPALMLAVAKAQAFNKAVLSVRKAEGRSRFEFLRYCFSNVHFTSLSTSALTTRYPVETLKFNYGTFAESYIPQRPDGQSASPVFGGWDLGNGTVLPGSNTC
jgi:type VI secretion system secreted protein Hcp